MKYLLGLFVLLLFLTSLTALWFMLLYTPVSFPNNLLILTFASTTFAFAFWFAHIIK